MIMECFGEPLCCSSYSPYPHRPIGECIYGGEAIKDILFIAHVRSLEFVNQKSHIM
jgi:hypothetical protein